MSCQTIPSRNSHLSARRDSSVALSHCETEWIPSEARRRAVALWEDHAASFERLRITESPEWLKLWLDHFGEHVPHEFIRVTGADRNTLGMGLICCGIGRKSGPVPVRTWHLGPGGGKADAAFYTEYTRPLVRPDAGARFADAIREAVHCRRDWDVFCFDGFSEEDLRTFQDAGPELLIEVRDCPFFDFTSVEPGTDLITQLGSSTRSNLRRQMKRLDDLRVEWAETLDTAHDIFDDLVQLHQERWQSIDQPGSFSCPVALAWSRALIDQLFPTGRVRLFRVTSGSEPIGCVLLLNDQSRLLDYFAGMSIAHASVSPGLVTHYLGLTEAHRRAYRGYDFLAGNQRHKQNLSNANTQLFWGRWLNRNLKNRTIGWMKAGYRMLKPASVSSQPTLKRESMKDASSVTRDG